MNTNLIIHFVVKSNHLQEFADVLEQVKHNLPEVKGCLGVKIYQSHTKPEQYTLLESWETQAKHEDHVKNLVESGAWETIAKHLEQEPESAYYSMI